MTLQHCIICLFLQIISKIRHNRALNSDLQPDRKAECLAWENYLSRVNTCVYLLDFCKKLDEKSFFLVPNYIVGSKANSNMVQSPSISNLVLTICQFNKMHDLWTDNDASRMQVTFKTFDHTKTLHSINMMRSVSTWTTVTM